MKKILLVEDQALVRDALFRALIDSDNLSNHSIADSSLQRPLHSVTLPDQSDGCIDFGSPQRHRCDRRYQTALSGRQGAAHDRTAW